MIDPASLSPWLWVIAPAVVLLAYIVFGMSGFGSTVVSVPILAHFLPINYLVPLMVLLDLCAALFVGTSGREHMSRGEIRRLVPFMFAGFALGITVMVKLPQDALRAALGVFALASITVLTQKRWLLVGAAASALIGASLAILAYIL